MYIPPSSLLSVADQNSLSSYNKRFENTPLRAGVITECFEIDDDNNITKITPEYTVVTNEQDSNGGNKFKTYKNCISTDGFGGVADFFEYKLRPTKKSFHKKEDSKKTSHDFKKQNGTMVLVLCLDGFSEKAIIIGGLPNLTTENPRKSTLTKDNELHLEGEYNGVNWQVNKDGEFTLTFKSKTDIDGKPQDEKSGGTHFQIDKKGSVDINTNLEEDDQTYINLDKEKKDINIKTGNNITTSVKKDVTIEAEGKISNKAKSDIAIEAEGSAKLTSKSSIDVEGKGAVNVKGSTVMINGQNLVTVDTQQCMINSSKVFVGQGGTPALLLTTKFFGTGAHGKPVISTAIGPFSSSVFIAT